MAHEHVLITGETSRSPGTPAARWIGLALIVAGLCIRLAVAFSSAPVEPRSDMLDYFRLAGGFRAEHIPVDADRPLAYPILLAGLMGLGFSSRIALYGIQALLSLITAGLIAWAAGCLIHPTVRIPALGLACCSLTLSQYCGLFLTENVFVPLLAVWVGLALHRHRSDAMASLGGVAAGVAVWVRPAALPLVAGTVVALALPPERRWRGAVSFLIAAVASIWVLARMMGAIAGPTVTWLPTAGINFLIGNSQDARWDGGGLSRLPPEVARIADPHARNRVAFRLGLSHAAEHPIETLARAAIRGVRLLGVNPGGTELEALSAYGVPKWSATVWLGFEWWTLCALATIGAVSSVGRTIAAKLAWLVLPFVASLLATFVQTRFRLPIFVLLIPLASWGITATTRHEASSIEQQHWPRSRRALAFALTLLFLAALADAVLRLTLSSQPPTRPRARAAVGRCQPRTHEGPGR